MQDIYGSDSEDMAVERHALSLRFAHDNNQDYITCPLARLVRDVQGNWTQDEIFRRYWRLTPMTGWYSVWTHCCCSYGRSASV